MKPSHVVLKDSDRLWGPWWWFQEWAAVKCPKSTKSCKSFWNRGQKPPNNPNIDGGTTVPGRQFIRFFMATWKGGRHSPSFFQPLSWVNGVVVTNWKLHRCKVDISHPPYSPHIMPASILLLSKGKTWWYIQLLLHFKVLTLPSVRKVNQVYWASQ